MQAFAFVKDLTTYWTVMYCAFLYFRLLLCSSCSVFAKGGCMEGVGHWLKCKNWGIYALSWAFKCTSQPECQCSDDAVCKERRCKLCCENFAPDWTHAAESDKLWEVDIVASLSVIQRPFQYWYFWWYSNIALSLSLLMSIVFFKFPCWYWCQFVKIPFYIDIDSSALSTNAGGKIGWISAVAFNIKIV